MTMRIFVPADSVARSLGADLTADAIEKRLPEATVIRTGSRGLYWLEPLLEIETNDGRVGFREATAGMVETLFTDGAADLDHPNCVGLIENIPYLRNQDRLTTARVGVIDPLSLEQYRAEGGFIGLEVARKLSAAEITDVVKESGLRGRGGAAFPTGIKWQTVLDAVSDKKYIVCNADEGDSGTFVDRMMMESDPFALIEGMVIAGLAVGADQGYIYCRAEYPQAISTLHEAINIADAEGILDGFNLGVRVAAGAYICGEETSMLESLEGKRGVVRYRPPLPAIEGLFGRPTVVNNVISLATIPVILARGSAFYREYGIGRSTGTATIQLAGNVRFGGLVELAFGHKLGDILDEFGGGTASGKPVKAVQTGGPLGAYLHPSQFDTTYDYESFKSIGAMIGHGGVVVFDTDADLGAMARFAMEFCALESCGKCTPCRVGSVRGVEVIDRIRAGHQVDDNRILLHDLCQTMVDGSLCALGGMAPYPVMSVMEHFPDEL